MKVIVDTVIWSLALRRSTPEDNVINDFTSLIEDQRIIMLGPIKQEVLSGYSDPHKFKKLKEKLSYFPNSPILDIDYEQAAEFHNICRRKGIQGSHVDFLLCACACRLNAMIYTRDKDFDHYSKHIPIQLFISNNG
ncbi:PIN domain-containing protein [Lentisphaera profundi]|uniref:PIN domain-containing protein n=1 Tax=Lentisphaera profundi TaxID=1658616 RepID=A0ABY7VV93_9BACT|nr:PIN domain-containing protein [Lentisphaera profundi]WDE98145.1 PIN domain-containing protein [Lentisphaera profundi]